MEDWLTLLADAQPPDERDTPAGEARRTLVLAVLRGGAARPARHRGRGAHHPRGDAGPAGPCERDGGDPEHWYVLAPMLDLRPCRPGDAPALHALLSDPEVAGGCAREGVERPLHAAPNARRWCPPRWRTGPPTASGPGWPGTATSCAGRCLLKHSIVDGRGEVEIGWAVARSYWGRGLGTAMGRHALAAGAEHGIANVVAFTRVDNLASQRVMQKLGLTYEREFEHAGLPHVLYRTSRERNPDE